MRIALAQMNSLLGGIDQNLQKIQQMTEQAREKNCQLIVFPELALLGYSPNDLLERPEVIESAVKAIKKLPKTKGISGIVGALTLNPKKNQKPLLNSAVQFPQITKSSHKTLLPSYDIFDETRFYASGDAAAKVMSIDGQRVGVLVCEDMWAWERREYDNPLAQLKKQKPRFVISINASPFSLGKRERRLKMAKHTARFLKCPVIYVNMIGGQDELIFDGGSFAVSAQGKILAQSAYFTEDLNVIDLEKKAGGLRAVPRSATETLHGALVLGIRDFARKNGFQKIHLGLSGGIDSAVALALAADAVGPLNVTALAMPGPFSASESFELAERLAKNVGCVFKTVEIKESYRQSIENFESTFGKMEFSLVHENAQARLRGFYLMMFANSQHSLLLTTGNKSEIATGYSTLYGDMCGGLAPLGDLLKGQVYDLARHYNQQYELIPQAIIDRAPSAELKPNQKDQDSLPPYDELDAAVQRVVEKGQKARTEIDTWLLKKIAQSEFKRWQSAPILRVSEHAFGRGRRFPATNAFYKK